MSGYWSERWRSGVSTSTSRPVAYFNTEQVQPFWNGLMAVRTSGPLGAMMPALRAARSDPAPGLREL